MPASLYTLDQFLRECREIVARRLDPAVTVAALLGPLERIIARPDCLADAPGHDPDPAHGFALPRAADLTIRAVVWLAGSGAPIHNHNSWALEGVITGTERNRNYQRTDDGSRPWQATLEELEPSEVLAGSTTLIPFPPADIHAVEIPAGKTLAIHLYGTDLASQWRYRFDPDSGAVTPFRGRSQAERR